MLLTLEVGKDLCLSEPTEIRDHSKGSYIYNHIDRTENSTIEQESWNGYSTINNSRVADEEIVT